MTEPSNQNSNGIFSRKELVSTIAGTVIATGIIQFVPYLMNNQESQISASHRIDRLEEKVERLNKKIRGNRRHIRKLRKK